LSAFTLAEVLITLGIIGIVAAMTIPTLMNNTGVTQFRSALNKEYSTLTQAVNVLQSQEGDLDLSSSDNFITQLGTQISIMKKGTWGSLTTLPATFNYKCYKNTSGTCGNLITRPAWDGISSFITNDGALFLVGSVTSSACNVTNWHSIIDTETLPQSNVCTIFLVDSNGDKNPNQLGMDMHYFYLLKRNGFYYVRPSGSNNATNCVTTSPDDYNGSLHCTARMLMNMPMP